MKTDQACGGLRVRMLVTAALLQLQVGPIERGGRLACTCPLSLSPAARAPTKHSSQRGAGPAVETQLPSPPEQGSQRCGPWRAGTA